MHCTRTRAGVSAAAGRGGLTSCLTITQPLGRMLHLCLGTTSPRLQRLPVFRAAQIGTNVDRPRSSLVSRARLALVTDHLIFPPAFSLVFTSRSRSRHCPPRIRFFVSLSLRISLSSTHLARSALRISLARSLSAASLAPRHSASLGAIWRASFPAGIRDTTFVFLKRLRLFFSSSKGDTIWRRGTTAPIDG